MLLANCRWRVAWVAVALLLGTVLVSIFVPQQPLMQFINICSLSVAVAVVITYAPAWAPALRKNALDGPDALSLGIGCTWTAEIGQRIWSIFWHGLERPEWMTQSYIIPLLLTLTVFGGIQHITAPGAVGGLVPKRNWIMLGVTFGIFTLIGLLVVWLGWFQPNRTA
jgi:hypothetical protein